MTFAPRRRSQAVAAAAVFAVVYALMGLFPVSALVGVGSFLTLREIASPLGGMLFGPAVGGLSMVIGNFVDFALGKPVVFDFLDFIPDLASAVVAGLAFTGRRRAAVALPAVLMLWYSLDPLSALTIDVGGAPVPYLWMHILSLLLLVGALAYESTGRLARTAPAFVGAVAFASTMAGHVAGGILYENVIFRLYGVVPQGGYLAFWTLVFFAYPLERVFFAVAGTVLSYSVIRALARRGQGAGQPEAPNGG
jgi:hypothetical protein